MFETSQETKGSELCDSNKRQRKWKEPNLVSSDNCIRRSGSNERQRRQQRWGKLGLGVCQGSEKTRDLARSVRLLRYDSFRNEKKRCSSIFLAWKYCSNYIFTELFTSQWRLVDCTSEKQKCHIDIEKEQKLMKMASEGQRRGLGWS